MIRGGEGVAPCACSQFSSNFTEEKQLTHDLREHLLEGGGESESPLSPLSSLLYPLLAELLRLSFSSHICICRATALVSLHHYSEPSSLLRAGSLVRLHHYRALVSLHHYSGSIQGVDLHDTQEMNMTKQPEVNLHAGRAFRRNSVTVFSFVQCISAIKTGSNMSSMSDTHGPQAHTA